MATHSPTFVAPESIKYVSRVYSQDQKSNIVRLNIEALPDNRHLFNIVNSQNNERLFFADRVVLVEGISDRLFFEAVLDLHGRSEANRLTIEVIAVGGKGFFESYRRILQACKIEYAMVADRDYVEQIGPNEIKSLFALNVSEIKKDVIDNVKSIDGKALVENIDTAMMTGKWGDAIATWEYIKSRRRELKPKLTPEEERLLSSFIKNLHKEKIFILSQGSLEAYLPEGYRDKNLDKIIRLVSEDDFWSKLENGSRQELSTIAKALLN